MISKGVPYCAVVSANVFNLVSMRSSELSEGIPIKVSSVSEFVMVSPVSVSVSVRVLAD